MVEGAILEIRFSHRIDLGKMSMGRRLRRQEPRLGNSIVLLEHCCKR